MPVKIIEDIFGKSTDLADTIRAVAGQSDPRIAIVADMNVIQRTPNIGSRVGAYFEKNKLNLACEPSILPGGEKIKNDGGFTLSRVLRALIDARIGARDCVLALGGGAVLDVASYAATQICGGLKVIRIPTSVAAMFDAGFADRAKMNAQNIKDAISLPAMPAAVLIDPLFARTVVDGVWRGAFGEIVRQAVAVDAPLLKKLPAFVEPFRERNMDVFRELLKLVVASRVKKGTSDFAKWLTLRLESMGAFMIPHGYAIPIAVHIELSYAAAKGYLDAEETAAVQDMLVRAGAMDAFAHSKPLLLRRDEIMIGLDTWMQLLGHEGIPLPKPFGKIVLEKEPDRELYATLCQKLAAGQPQ